MLDTVYFLKLILFKFLFSNSCKHFLLTESNLTWSKGRFKLFSVIIIALQPFYGRKTSNYTISMYNLLSENFSSKQYTMFYNDKLLNFL